MFHDCGLFWVTTFLSIMSICFCGEIRKMVIRLSLLSGPMNLVKHCVYKDKAKCSLFPNLVFTIPDTEHNNKTIRTKQKHHKNSPI